MFGYDGLVAPDAADGWAGVEMAYDPERANQLLEELGLRRDPATERRLGPSGEPIKIIANYPDSYPLYFEQAVQRLKDYWAVVGIDLESYALNDRDWQERLVDNALLLTISDPDQIASDLSLELSPISLNESLGQLEISISQVPADTPWGTDLRSLLESARTVLDLVDTQPDVYSSSEMEILDAELRFLREVAGKLEEFSGDVERLSRNVRRILTGLMAVFSDRAEKSEQRAARSSMKVWVEVVEEDLETPSNGLRVYLRSPLRRANGKRLPERFIDRSQVEGKERWAEVACYYAKDERSDLVTSIVYQEPVYPAEGPLIVEVELTDWGSNSAEIHIDELCE